VFRNSKTRPIRRCVDDEEKQESEAEDEDEIDFAAGFEGLS
jgi:hypothetical protein